MRYYLDGKEILDVVAIDPEKSQVTVYQRHWSTGELVRGPDGNLAKIVIKGQIRVEPETAKEQGKDFKEWGEEFAADLGLCAPRQLFPAKDLGPDCCPNCGGYCDSRYGVPGCRTGCYCWASIDQVTSANNRKLVQEIVRKLAQILARHRER